MNIKMILQKMIMLFPDELYNRIILSKEHIQLGTESRIKGKMMISNKGICVIGDHFHCNSGVLNNTVGGPYMTSLQVQKNAELMIGNNVGMSGTVISVRDRVIIDDYVMIGSGCCIYDNDFHSLNFEERIHGFEGIKSKPIHISEGVFIGSRSIILKGVTIGKHSIIGAGAVVTSDVPENEVWAGNPAVFVRRV